MNGQKERLMVLDMIAEGKITAEEAEELFKAMDATEEPASDSPELVSSLSHLSQLSSLANPPSMTGRSSSKDLIAALKEANIDQVTLSDVQELQAHKLTAEYVREMLALGVEPDGLGEWISLRIHNITPRYVRELRDMGMKSLDVDELVELNIHGVSAKYVSGLHELGLKDFDADQLVELMNNDVSPKYIAELHQAGVKELEVDGKATNATLEIDLGKTKLPAGTHTFSLQAQTTGKYRNNPEGADLAAAQVKEAEKLAAEAAAAARKAGEEFERMAKASSEAESAAQSATASTPISRCFAIGG